ncbi:inactive carboxypeptidase-like protein X2 [Patiria miniata]|uniref:F5/8 type C domain-containing protein n=1 Tax=Patiria miniata TaxID=46514 RepID=A0A914BN13_PATMI|nr:inactive carboxypeptidase-like protein X2 [Patiria miniata]
MGMASGLIPDSRLSASAYGDSISKADIRITGGGWCARRKTGNPWVQADLEQACNVTGIQYAGGPDDGTPDRFIVMYSANTIDQLQNVKNEEQTGDAVFDGTTRDVVVTARFPTAVYARYIRLKPPTWDWNVEYKNGNPFCLRFELLGCR